MTAFGILIDYEWCTGCHTCETACQMERDLPFNQFGIKIASVGPWEYAEDVWQYSYMPIPTDQCNLCEDRTAKGKLPSCVHHCQAKCLDYGPLEQLETKMDKKPKQALFRLA